MLGLGPGLEEGTAAEPAKTSHMLCPLFHHHYLQGEWLSGTPKALDFSSFDGESPQDPIDTAAPWER